MFDSIITYIRNTIEPPVLRFYNHPLVFPIIDPIYIILRDTINNYNRHKVFRLGAALAYYTIFSLPALLIVVIGLVGFFLGEAAVRGEVFINLKESVGPEAAKQIQDAVINIGTPDANWWATVLGVGLLIFVATGVFYALQDALNHIFEVKEVPRKVKIIEVLINRVLSLGMVMSIGALLVVSIVLNALFLKISDFIASNETWVHSKVPNFIIPYLDYTTDYFLVFLNMGISVFLIALFFAMLYKILPAVKLRWSYIWAGSFFSAILFWFGEIMMGYYLSSTSVISAYGAAGSLIVVLIWVSYSSQLIFLGAEFIIAASNYWNVDIEPKKFAVALQKVKRRKKKKKKRGSIDDYVDNFGLGAPPSHFQMGFIQDAIDQLVDEHEYEAEEIEVLLEDESLDSSNEELGFNEDKNINLTDPEVEDEPKK